MPKLTIDNRPVEVDAGSTILDAADKLGIAVPTMCFMKGLTPATSCMVCVVKVNGSPLLLPACGALVANGMVVQTDTPDVIEARRAALELLLSDHLGDCMGPCHVTCPATMNIPLMLRQIAAGRLREAIRTVKADIALPAVLGRICAAPCEKACRRAPHDGPVPICLLKRYVADVDLDSDEPYSPPCKDRIGKRVAIVGAGPAGLAAAYYLAQDGIDCTLFDDHDRPGGALRYAVPAEQLPRQVVDDEVAAITALGVQFNGSTRIGKDVPLAELRRDYDAVFFAVGKIETETARQLGFETGRDGVAIDRRTYATNIEGVFAGGDAVRNRKVCVRAVADGKEAAASIGQFVRGRPVTGPDTPFNTRIGKLQDGEIDAFLASSSPAPAVRNPDLVNGLTDEQAVAQALRCLHCDCRKPDACKLRLYSRQYDAQPGRYKAGRKTFSQNTGHPDIIFEPGKCIDCGLCIQIAARSKERLGLTFIGRGFNVKVAVPFDKPLCEALAQVARDCAAACPTGALAVKD